MSWRSRIERVVDRVLKIEPVFAHCDVPCGIYDPHLAALSAKTVHTMNQKLTALPTRPLPRRLKRRWSTATRSSAWSKPKRRMPSCASRSC